MKINKIKINKKEAISLAAGKIHLTSKIFKKEILIPNKCISYANQKQCNILMKNHMNIINS